MNESIYGKNKKYLSYSSINLWYKNKEEFRNRYYKGKKAFENAYTIFGHELHEAIETDPRLSHIPRLSKKELEIHLKIDDVPVRSFIDSACIETCSFLEYKSGLKKADGSFRWTEQDVKNHKQLPFYALMLKEKYGKYNPETALIMLETDWEHNKKTIGNVEILFSEKLILTGKAIIYSRIIEEQELVHIRDWITTASREIIEDYKIWNRQR